MLFSRPPIAPLRFPLLIFLPRSTVSEPPSDARGRRRGRVGTRSVAIRSAGRCRGGRGRRRIADDVSGGGGVADAFVRWGRTAAAATLVPAAAAMRTGTGIATEWERGTGDKQQVFEPGAALQSNASRAVADPDARRRKKRESETRGRRSRGLHHCSLELWREHRSTAKRRRRLEISLFPLGQFPAEAEEGLDLSLLLSTRAASQREEERKAPANKREKREERKGSTRKIEKGETSMSAPPPPPGSSGAPAPPPGAQHHQGGPPGGGFVPSNGMGES